MISYVIQITIIQLISNTLRARLVGVGRPSLGHRMANDRSRAHNKNGRRCKLSALGLLLGAFSLCVGLGRRDQAVARRFELARNRFLVVHTRLAVADSVPSSYILLINFFLISLLSSVWM